jgi:hypothetical protein
VYLQEPRLTSTRRPGAAVVSGFRSCRATGSSVLNWFEELKARVPAEGS